MRIISNSQKPFLPPRRLITNEENNNRLDPLLSTGSIPSDFLSLSKINSNIIEIIDTGYQWTGLWSAIATPGLVLLPIGINSMFKMGWGYGLFAILLGLPVLMLCGFLFWMDIFKWTHYPTVISRKFRTVFVFRADGSVLCVPWSEILFTMTSHGDAALSAVNLRGCVMDTDGEHVIESFDFGTQCESREGALRQWEFFRQYMLNGPKDLIGNVKYCMPSGKRESYFTGLERISAQYPGIFFKILLFPFSLYVSIFRFLAMRTHRIPVWPKEVEDACAIEPGDPYVKDYRSNPKDLQ